MRQSSWAEPALPRASNGAAVLVVDDDEGSRSILAEALRALGYWPREAEDGGAALRQLTEQLPDLICTDLRMPGMDGSEFAALVRTVAPDVPLILVSGCGAADLASAAVRMGAAAVLPKPFSISDLASILPRVLHGGSPNGGPTRPAADGTSAEGGPRARTLLFDPTVLQKASQLSQLTQFAASLWSAPVDRGSGSAEAAPLLEGVVGRTLDTLLHAMPGQRAVLVLTEGGRPQSVLGRGRPDLDVPLGQIAEHVVGGSGGPWHGYLDGHPVAAAPLVIQGGAVGMICVVRERAELPFSWSAAELLQAFSAHAAGALENACMGRQLAQAFQETVAALIAALEARHKYTEGHSLRVARYARGTAASIGLSESACERIQTAGLLHDLGKVGVRDAILDKPGRLTEDEWGAMRQHPALGARILQPLGFLEEESRFVHSHHERLDGSGYPDGLTGAEIPLGARMIAVADAFDAMCSARSYRPAAPPQAALRELERSAGSQFDAAIVAAFCRWVASHPDSLPAN